MMDQSISRSDCHAFISKYLPPTAKGMITRNDQAPSLIPMSDQFKQ